jgi:hypothetical protein
MVTLAVFVIVALFMSARLPGCPLAVADPPAAGAAAPARGP